MIKYDTSNLTTELFYKNLDYNKYIRENDINIIFKFKYFQSDIDNATDENTIYIFCDFRDIRIKYNDLLFYSDDYNHTMQFRTKNSVDSTNIDSYNFIDYFIIYYRDIFKDIFKLDYTDAYLIDKIKVIENKMHNKINSK